MSNDATKLGMVLAIDQPPGTGAPQWATPMQFEATGAGGADGDTTVSSTLGTETTSDHQPVGWLVEDVDDDANGLLRRRVVDYVDATGTLTHDRFPAQRVANDSSRLIVPTHPYWSEDTGGSAAQIQDATRSEAVDTWNGSAEEGGPYVEAVRADNVVATKLHGPITDFQAGGIAVVDLSAQLTAITDLYEAWQCLEWIDNNPLELTLERIAREAYAGTFDVPRDALGRRSAKATKRLPFTGPGRTRAGEPGPSHRLFKAATDYQTPTGDLTAHLGGAVDSVVFDAGAVTKGHLYCTEEGDVFMAGSAASPCTPYPSLRTPAVDGSTITELCTYHPATDLNAHLAFKQFRGDRFCEYIWGAVAKWSFALELGRFLEMSLDIEGCDWLQLCKDRSGHIARAWRGKRPTVHPFKLNGGRVVIGSTTYKLKKATVNLQQQYVLDEDFQAPNHVVGYRYAGANPVGQMVLVADNTHAQLINERDSGREIGPLLVQAGSRPGTPGVWAFYGDRIQMGNVQVGDDGGKQSLTCDWKVIDRDTDTTGLPTWAVGMG